MVSTSLRPTSSPGTRTQALGEAQRTRWGNRDGPRFKDMQLLRRVRLGPAAYVPRALGACGGDRETARHGPKRAPSERVPVLGTSTRRTSCRSWDPSPTNGSGRSSAVNSATRPRRGASCPHRNAVRLPGPVRPASQEGVPRRRRGAEHGAAVASMRQCGGKHAAERKTWRMLLDLRPLEARSRSL